MTKRKVVISFAVFDFEKNVVSSIEKCTNVVTYIKNIPKITYHSVPLSKHIISLSYLWFTKYPTISQDAKNIIVD
jgi:uncharacterized membrane protein